MEILINNFRQEIKIGVTPEERAFPQILSLNITITGDFKQALINDSLEGTVDYTKICELVQDYVSGQEWKLMEKFVFDLAHFIKKVSPLIQEVRVKACKNVMTQVDSISVSYFLSNEIKKN